MDITVTLTEEQQELLEDIVKDVNQEDNQTIVTIKSYCQGILDSWIASIVNQETQFYVMHSNREEIKANIHKSARDIRRLNKAIKLRK